MTAASNTYSLPSQEQGDVGEVMIKARTPVPQQASRDPAAAALQRAEEMAGAGAAGALERSQSASSARGSTEPGARQVTAATPAACHCFADRAV